MENEHSKESPFMSFEELKRYGCMSTIDIQQPELKIDNDKVEFGKGFMKALEKLYRKQIKNRRRWG